MEEVQKNLFCKATSYLKENGRKRQMVLQRRRKHQI